jgi:hypothetical protein
VSEYLGAGFPRTLLPYKRITSNNFKQILLPFEYSDGTSKKLWSVGQQVGDAKEAFSSSDNEGPLSFENAVVMGHNADVVPLLTTLFLVQTLRKKRPNLRVSWVALHPGAAQKKEDDLLVTVHADITVYFNVYHDSTPWRQEMVRDLMTLNPNAKIVVSSGCNPFAFAARVLRRPAHVALYCNG